MKISDSDHPEREGIIQRLNLVRQQIIQDEDNEKRIFEQRKNIEEEEGQINFRRVSDQNINLPLNRVDPERVNLILNCSFILGILCGENRGRK